MNKTNQKFKGTLNGKEYHDIDEFLRDYHDILQLQDQDNPNPIEANMNLDINARSEDSEESPEETRKVDLSSLYKTLPVFGELIEKTGLESSVLSNDMLIETYENTKQDPIKEIQKALDDHENPAVPPQIERELDKLDPESLDKLNNVATRIIGALSEKRANLNSQLDELTDELEKINALLTFYKGTMKTCESNKKHYKEYKKLYSSAQRSDELLDGIFNLIAKTMGLPSHI